MEKLTGLCESSKRTVNTAIDLGYKLVGYSVHYGIDKIPFVEVEFEYLFEEGKSTHQEALIEFMPYIERLIKIEASVFKMKISICNRD